MKHFVYWTGVYNIGVGIAFLFPGLVAVLGIDAPDSAFWCRFPALIVIFLGVLLVLCSRDLSSRGSIVFWEGILRVGVSLVVVGYGYMDNLGLVLVILGAIDLLIGLVYVVGLPRVLQVTAKQLLLDAAIPYAERWLLGDQYDEQCVASPPVSEIAKIRKPTQ